MFRNEHVNPDKKLEHPVILTSSVFFLQFCTLSGWQLSYFLRFFGCTSTRAQTHTYTFPRMRLSDSVLVMEWLNRRGPCCSGFSLSRTQTHTYAPTPWPCSGSRDAVPRGSPATWWMAAEPSLSCPTHTHNLIWEQTGHARTHTAVISSCGSRNDTVAKEMDPYWSVLSSAYSIPWIRLASLSIPMRFRWWEAVSFTQICKTLCIIYTVPGV